MEVNASFTICHPRSLFILQTYTHKPPKQTHNRQKVFFSQAWVLSMHTTNTFRDVRVCVCVCAYSETSDEGEMTEFGTRCVCIYINGTLL